MNNKIPKVILLVEDEILIAMVQKKFLEQYGYNVITIETGEKAVEIFIHLKNLGKTIKK